jgi:hypothetical protein
VFDLSANAADALLAFVATQNLKQFSFTRCDALPPLQPEKDLGGDGGGGGSYRGSGGRGRRVARNPGTVVA